MHRRHSLSAVVDATVSMQGCNPQPQRRSRSTLPLPQRIVALLLPVLTVVRPPAPARSRRARLVAWPPLELLRSSRRTQLVAAASLEEHAGGWRRASSRAAAWGV